MLESVGSLIDALGIAALLSATSLHEWLVAVLLISIANPEEGNIAESEDVGVS